MNNTNHVNPPQPTHVNDFLERVGEHYVGQWLSFEEDRLAGFWSGAYQDLTYGDQLGDEYPEGLVEGFYQLSLIDYLSAEIIGRWHGFNYGTNKVRFLQPLIDTQRIRLALTIANAEEKSNGILVTYDVELQVEGSTKPCMVAEWLVLLQDFS